MLCCLLKTSLKFNWVQLSYSPERFTMAFLLLLEYIFTFSQWLPFHCFLLMVFMSQSDISDTGSSPPITLCVCVFVCGCVCVCVCVCVWVGVCLGVGVFVSLHLLVPLFYKLIFYFFSHKYLYLIYTILKTSYFYGKTLASKCNSIIWG